MTEQDYEAVLEECRGKVNEAAKLLGTKELDQEAFRRLIESPLESPEMALTRMEDEQYPSRLCAWCFHPRNSPECDFAAKHAPYREMFA